MSLKKQMIYRIIKFAVLLIVLSGVVGCKHACPNQYDSNSSKPFYKKIMHLMDQNMIPGIIIAIIENDNIKTIKAYHLKNLEKNSCFNENTVFEAASLSKPVFAYGVLKMVENGELDLDKPLSEYFQYTDVKNDPRAKLITARMVLSHTTGYPNWRHKNQDLRTYFQPGQKFSYSGEGFVHLQKVVEKISGQSLEQYMQRTVLIPLNMLHSSYTWKTEYDQHKTYGYDAKGQPYPKRNRKKFNAAFSLHTMARDYAKFILAMISQNRLQKKIVKDMLTTEIRVATDGPFCLEACSNNLSSSITWGLGWGLQQTLNDTSFWHWGSNKGFKSYAAGFKDGRGIVVFTNSDNGLKVMPEIIQLTMGFNHPAINWLS